MPPKMHKEAPLFDAAKNAPHKATAPFRSVTRTLGHRRHAVTPSRRHRGNRMTDEITDSCAFRDQLTAASI
jgi:hypothetical protein